MDIGNEVISIYNNYADENSLPNDFKVLDLLARKLIGRLHYETEKPIRILKDIHPNISSKYLVGSLRDIDTGKYSKEILKYYGPRRVTVGPLVGALREDIIRPIVIEILMDYGACRITIQTLIGSLKDESIEDTSSQIIIDYGGEAIPFISRPTVSNPVYVPLIKIYNTINKINE